MKSAHHFFKKIKLIKIYKFEHNLLLDSVVVSVVTVSLLLQVLFESTKREIKFSVFYISFFKTIVVYEAYKTNFSSLFQVIKWMLI
jgi:hypothetical protein